MFGKKSKCVNCRSKISEDYEFCPYCGIDLQNPEADMEDFGLLGKSNDMSGAPLAGGLGGLGITDKMITSVMNSLIKNLNKQMNSAEDNPEIRNFPNGINIRFGVANPNAKTQVKGKSKKVEKGITEEQISRMRGMPRVEAKSNVKRLSDKVLYELKLAGVDSADDIFISKLESGYEVKAIGKKKVYVNSLPVNLPLKGYSLDKNGLVVEFGLN